MDRGTKISIALTILFVGIPAIGNFYFPLFAEFFGWLPLTLIFTWMGRVGILFLGFTLGWYIRGDVETTDAERVEKIEGCIEKDDIAWKGRAILSRGAIVNIDVEYKQICPECQTPMKKESYHMSSGRHRTRPSYGGSATTRKVWECPNSGCGHTTTREAGQHGEAESLFERHIRRIVESQGEEYSLQSLLNRIGEDEETTPRRIWEEYAEVVDDPQVSTNCFH